MPELSGEQSTTQERADAVRQSTLQMSALGRKYTPEANIPGC
ncbi:MAG TPA: hypothetical protein PLQ56_01575 [Aggregatilineales bacterium]|nr:hypothetical protein [Aggregatilineales bacterium]